jgi:nucleoside-diphosphate-sugar epimerase
VKALVTGGGGFLGGAIVRRLAETGAQNVRSLSRGRYPDLLKLGVECVEGDLADTAAVAKACAGCDTVFHVAGKVGLWGRYEDYLRANVEGTRNIIKACRQQGVRRLVFTGSPSVVFDGGDVDGWDESAPYPRKFDSYYSQTKATAEDMVLSANGPDLLTVSLRPHLVWGPGDRHIAPRMIAKARAGQLRRIGSFNKKVDITYIDDAVEAHLLAARRLEESSAVAGHAFFLSQGDPRPIWDIVNAILATAAVPPVTQSVPLRTARIAASAYEGLYRFFGIQDEPRLTRFLVTQLTTAHWFDIGAARRDLGYRPRVSFEEGLLRLKAVPTA